jgi:hypothetical protein
MRYLEQALRPRKSRLVGLPALEKEEEEEGEGGPATAMSACLPWRTGIFWYAAGLPALEEGGGQVRVRCWLEDWLACPGGGGVVAAAAAKPYTYGWRACLPWRRLSRARRGGSRWWPCRVAALPALEVGGSLNGCPACPGDEG